MTSFILRAAGSRVDLYSSHKNIQNSKLIFIIPLCHSTHYYYPLIIHIFEHIFILLLCLPSCLSFAQLILLFEYFCDLEVSSSVQCAVCSVYSIYIVTYSLWRQSYHVKIAIVCGQPRETSRLQPQDGHQVKRLQHTSFAFSETPQCHVCCPR